MTRYDLTIIGAGPAGLSAAINASSEGLSVLLIDSQKYVGGQSRYSSAVENFLGFAHGVTGEQLSHIGERQARKFGANLALGHAVASVSTDGSDKVVTTAQGLSAVSRALLISSGLQWRELEADGAKDFASHLLYGGMKTLAPHYAKKHVLILGGGNSAGQAAIRWSRYAQVTLAAREPLKQTMSTYLITTIQSSNVRVIEGHSIQRMSGENGKLATCTLDNGDVPCDAVIPMIGSVPKTEFCRAVCECDEHGFLITGKLPGVFIAGDCRKDSVKRIAVAVGEGSAIVPQIHKYLA